MSSTNNETITYPCLMEYTGESDCEMEIMEFRQPGFGVLVYGPSDLYLLGGVHENLDMSCWKPFTGDPSIINPIYRNVFANETEPENASK